MKILFTSNRFYPDIGGIESVSSLLANYFVEAGHSLRLITQSVGDSAVDHKLFAFPILRQPSFLDLLACYRWADVVFQNNLELRQLWPAVLFRRPLVIGLQTWIRSVEGYRSPVNRLKLAALSSASVVVACSEAIRADSTDRALVIGNPYCSKLFRYLPNEPRRSAIVFLGRLVSDKGVDLLLRAYAALGRFDWSLTIIGSGPEDSLLKRLADELCISSSVTFLGPLQDEALVRVLNQHELMVVPSQWREPFGVVVLEGSACGCVVLASDGGGLPDAVGSAGLLFRRGDQADLTAKLNSLIENAELRAHFRAQAHAHLSQFKDHQVCAQYLQLLEKIYVEKPY